MHRKKTIQNLYPGEGVRVKENIMEGGVKIFSKFYLIFGFV